MVPSNKKLERYNTRILDYTWYLKNHFDDLPSLKTAGLLYGFTKYEPIYMNVLFITVWFKRSQFVLLSERSWNIPKEGTE